MYKILFTDIDGVLVTYRHNIKSTSPFQFDPDCVKELNYIIEKTSAKMVISSSWRHNFNWDELTRVFKSEGVVGEIVGITPTADNFGTPRGDEIQSWLEEHKDEVSKFAIIDDNSDMGNLMQYLVKTNTSMGLTRQAADRVIKMLE